MIKEVVGLNIPSLKGKAVWKQQAGIQPNIVIPVHKYIQDNHQEIMIYHVDNQYHTCLDTSRHVHHHVVTVCTSMNDNMITSTTLGSLHKFY